MLGWTAYAVLVSGLSALAAAAAERALRLCGLPARGVWPVAMAVSAGLPLLAALGAGLPAPEVVLPSLGVSEAVNGLGAAGPGGSGAGAGGGPSLDVLLLGGWGMAAAAGLSWLALSAYRLRRSLVRTPTRSVGGVTVHLTENEGPACWSLPGLRARVLLPAWLRELGPEGRRLAVAHERQHLRRGDSMLTAAGCLFVAVAPWNLPLWWQLGRLRRAVELDCDARVLGGGADPRSYGDLLLTVGGRAGGVAWSGLPLLEDARRLEERIRVMTSSPGEYRFLKAGAFSVLALLIGALAAETAPPARPTSGAPADMLTPTERETESRPIFRPHSEAPELQNPEVVSQRLQALYPDSLQQAGTGGTVDLRIYIDRDGEVARSRVEESSGIAALDHAALQVVDAMKFSPALNRDQRRAVWIEQKVQFRPAPSGGSSPPSDDRR